MSQRYSERFEHALIFSQRLHRFQVRKGTEIPYISHLLAVSSIVIEAGGDEDEAIAALLHDGPEDQGGEKVLAEIREKFGDRVANIVAECSDTFETPKPAWKQRKLNYIHQLSERSQSALIISCADKLHNIRSILSDYRISGEKIWERFNGGKEGTLWYYQSLVEIYKNSSLPEGLVDEISKILDELIILSKY